MRLATLALAALLSGCAPSNLAEWQKALGGDTSNLCVNNTLSTPWGTQNLRAARTNCPNCYVECSPDGRMTVRPGGADGSGQSVTVPLQVTPQQLAPVKPQ